MIESIAIPEERIKILRKNDNWKKTLEKLTNAKIELNDVVSIECEDYFMLKRLVLVIKAFGRGFNFDDALDLLDEDYQLEIINVKDYGKSKERQRVLKGRVIGRGGRIKKIIEENCNAKIAVYGKTIGVICKSTEIGKALEAIDMILSGSKHSTVIRFLRKS